MNNTDLAASSFPPGLLGVDGLPIDDEEPESGPQPSSGSTTTLAVQPASAPSRSPTARGPWTGVEASPEESLEELAGRINDAHRDLVLTVVEQARVIGERLLLAKAQLGHGNFSRWIDENCDFSASTGRGYMRVAEHWNVVNEMLAAKQQRATDLSLRGILRSIAERKADAEHGAREEQATPALHERAVAILRMPILSRVSRSRPTTLMPRKRRQPRRTNLSRT